MTTNIKYIPVRQKNFLFYNSVIDIKDLLNLTEIVERKSQYYEKIELDIFDLENSIEEVDQLKLNAGIQRELIPNKLSQIADYLKEENGIFPNSIILNISDRLELVSFENNQISIPEDKSILITAIDGQHILMGFRKYLEKYDDNELFEVPITIFYNLELDFQAYIFSIINSKQTKINKSLLYDLLALTKKDVDDFKLSHEIATWLQTNDKSTLKGNFKMLGKGDGWLSQAAFIDYLMPLIHNSKRRKVPPIFLPFSQEKEYFKIAFFINDYFIALIKTYSEEFYSDNYIFRTSFTFGLFMKLMPYVFIYSLKNDSLDYDSSKIEEIFNKIKSSGIDFEKGGKNSGVGSIGKQNQLLNEVVSAIEDKNINFQEEFLKFKKYFA
jgi:DGQHR domain-containing protein